MIFFAGDESGQNRHEAPYEVFAVAGVPAKRLWQFTQRFDSLQIEHFGVKLRDVGVECKGKKLLKKKKFRLAQQMGLMDASMRRRLTSQLLHEQYIAMTEGRPEYKPSKAEMTAYAQSSIRFVRDVFLSAEKCGVKVFASVIPSNSPLASTKDRFLRKDYRILLQRIGNFMSDLGRKETGLLVFDELERKQSRELIHQFENYCTDTARGYSLSRYLVPTPFFVRSDLTPIIQLADLLAYVISWGYRKGRINRDGRPELSDLAKIIGNMEFFHQSKHELFGRSLKERSIFFLLSPYNDGEEPDNKKSQKIKKADRGQWPPSAKRQKAEPMPPQQMSLILDAESKDLFGFPINKSQYFDRKGQTRPQK